MTSSRMLRKYRQYLPKPSGTIEGTLKVSIAQVVEHKPQALDDIGSNPITYRGAKNPS